MFKDCSRNFIARNIFNINISTSPLDLGGWGSRSDCDVVTRLLVVGKHPLISHRPQDGWNMEQSRLLPGWLPGKMATGADWPMLSHGEAGWCQRRLAETRGGTWTVAIPKHQTEVCPASYDWQGLPVSPSHSPTKMTQFFIIKCCKNRENHQNSVTLK